MRKYLFILILVFIAFAKNEAYSQIIQRFSYSVEDGLSQSNVNCLLKDERGFLWIGTQDGLNRYDGYEFKIFKNLPGDTNSISNNYINDLIEDEDGKIWIATNQGLNYFNPYNGDFKTFYTKKQDNSLPENRVLDLYYDQNGIIWIKTLHYLSRFNSKTQTFSNYKHYSDYFNFYDGISTYEILRDKKGRLWVATKDGLNYFDEEREVFKRYKYEKGNRSSLTDNNIQTIYEDRKGNLWIGTNSGLSKYNSEKDSFENFNINAGDGTPIGRNSVNAVYQDFEGYLWIGTDAGLYIFNTEKEKFNSANKWVAKSSRLLEANIRSIEQSREKIIWIGTQQGLLKLQRSLKDFKVYAKDQENEPLFGSNLIASIFQDDYGKLWVGTWDKGVYIYDRSSGEIRNYNQRNSQIPDNDVHSLFYDSNNRLWIGTGSGVLYYDFQDQSFQKPDFSNWSQVFQDNRVYSIDEDKKNNIWFATRNGLHVYDGKKLQSYYNESYDKNSISSNFVYDVMVDSNQDIWAATNNGLNLFDPDSEVFTRYLRKSQTCKNCIVSNEVISLHEDKKGNIWIGTVGGLNKYDTTNDVFFTYTEQNGLPNNLVYSIEEDNSGNIWISTNMGLAMYDRKRDSFRIYSIYDGLQNYEFNHLASYKNKEGEIFFGGLSGINYFYPDSIKTSNYKPDVKITSLEILANKKTKQIFYIKHDSIYIPYNNDLLTIKFAALDMAESRESNYAYRMKGLENEWVKISKRRYATFSNLPPGKYTFSVKGSNSDGIWFDSGTHLHIIVNTPFWLTKFAKAFYILAIIFLIVLLFRWRTKRLRKANQELKEKEIIAQQVAKQKEELSIKNKSITDSLIYAKRIQEALLPSRTTIESACPNSFVLYKPKDIVSGDFYWINEKGNKLFIAAVDCTGHGVPGAFMSIIGLELLDNITNEQGIEEADKILYDLNKGISLTLSRDDQERKIIRDGMDISLCVIDKNKKQLQFAGAFRPLYMIRDNKINEIKGDRFSIGMMEDSMENPKVTVHTFDLKQEDIVYIFTDGYADQFGGSEGKKYKYRRFRHLLLNIHKLPMDKQKEYLDNSIEDWKGELEQVDDILIIGFKPYL